MDAFGYAVIAFGFLGYCVLFVALTEGGLTIKRSSDRAADLDNACAECGGDLDAECFCIDCGLDNLSNDDPLNLEEDEIAL